MSAVLASTDTIAAIQEAERFLKILDRSASKFTFQIFGEGDARKSIQPRHFNAPFKDVASMLSHANTAGAGVFVAINETDGRGRSTENIVRARALWVDIDDDVAGEKRSVLLAHEYPPHIVVESSQNKTHAYWIVTGVELQQQPELLRAICAKFGGDKNACDIARVLRVPGFYHRKGEPFLCRIVSTCERPAYTAAEMLEAFPLAPAAAQKASTAVSTAPAVTVDETAARELRSALAYLPADDRELWIRMGCALSELGDVGYELWTDWSRTSEKHQPIEDACTWETLRHDRTGYRAVFAEARRHGWASGTTHSDASPNIVVVNAAALLMHDFPPREVLLDPWLQSQSLTMIYAWRGVGKTHVALGIACALASGGPFLSWRAPYPTQVLYIDGEMPGAALRNRPAAAMASSEKPILDGYLKIITPDMQQNGVMPNLATQVGQQAIDRILGDAKVIIVDNLSCLARGGKENEAEDWLPLAEWSLRMRATGRSVIFIHHAGKGGQQRGTSKREDLLDTVIALRRSNDYRAEQGARFEIHFEKARALYGQDVAATEATLVTTPDHRQVWVTKTVEAIADARMIELAELGMRQAEIARELNCHRSTVMRALRKAEDEGRYKPARQTSDSLAATPAPINNVLRVARPKVRNTQRDRSETNIQ